MILIIIGLLVVLVGFSLRKNPQPQFAAFKSLPLIIGAVMVIIGLLSSIFVIIEPGSVGGTSAIWESE